ncbi:ABC transporter substrate-binding protein [Streptomyces sp. NRRL S-87]|uniref:ABC transporter substrate-binding protein n=1 Tax=Streptomyces sp. NRRL S-87 TaxID=1463920 RepID=UPI000AA2A004|nr:ABC transporter substrate-binding protein [Streptomyces sp. NRRL S-87]
MARPLPQGIEYLIEQFDTFAARRGGSRRIPVVLLKRDPAESWRTHASTGRTVILEYRDRLRDTEQTPAVDLVPHALVEDDDASPRDALPGEEDRDPPGQHVQLLDAVVEQLESAMPPGAGELRLPRFHTCRAALDVRVGAGPTAARRRRLRDALYAQLLLRRPLLNALAGLAGATGGNFVSAAWSSLVQLLVVGLPRRVYGLWLSRRGTLRWLGSRRPKGANFLRVALTVTPAGTSRSNHALIQRMLLMALLNDLSRAARPSWLWVHRARRRWPFVLLLPDVGGEGTPVRQLLDTYADIARTERPAPLMVLGAVSDEPPSYAQVLSADPRSVTVLGDRVEGLYARGTSAVYVVPLSAHDDDGPADLWWETNPVVPVRANGRGDYVRVVAVPVVVLALVAGGLYSFAHRAAPSCHEVSTGETVGITDGHQCRFGVPGRDTELLALQEIAARQNDAAVHSGRPYRTVVFFAPLTTKVGDSTPVSMQSLRGALAAQSEINSRVGDVVQVRLLIANAGQYFAYGSRNDRGPDVARQIIDRQDRDGIAAVVGITQSRPASLAAVEELSDANIPVIGNSVTGSRMVDERHPPTYFQVSPSNDRIGQVMAAFATHAEQLAELTTPKDGGRTAVVVYDPYDEFFSSDLRTKFAEYYKGGKVVTVSYYEHRNQDVKAVAHEICGKVRASGGFILYAGRSGEMPELFDTLDRAPDCNKEDGKPVAVFAESVDAAYLQDPARMLREHPHLKPFYVTLNDSNGAKRPGSPYSEFISRFRTVFGPGPVPEGNAAGAYDALRLTAESITSIYGLNKSSQSGGATVRPGDVLQQLSNGIRDFSGTSGLLSLDSGHRYPPNKAVYVMEPRTDGSVRTLLACGLLPDQPPGLNHPATWGGRDTPHPCPVDAP